MPTVFIPSMLRSVTGGKEALEVEGSTVREVINNLESIAPGLRAELVQDGALKPNLAVAVDGAVAPLGLFEPVDPDSEIHFVAAISGGFLPLQFGTICD